MKKLSSFFTRSVRAGEDHSRNHGALSVPIYNASVYAFEDADIAAAVHNFEAPGYFYGKLGNPTQQALEETVCELESGDGAICFASGMAAISAAILGLAKTGDHIVAPRSMYATTTLLLNHLAERYGFEVTYIDDSSAASYASASRTSTRIFWIETPSNPLLNITDLPAVAAVAKEKNIYTVADNTFASPFNQNPLEHGVDVVVHSATKYLGGHSDLTAGLLVGTDNALVDGIRHSTAKLLGGSISPDVAALVLRGIKTLAVRMRQHNDNAYALAHMLSDHSKIESVFYPGLSDHPGHETARDQMRGFGGIVSFDVGTQDAGKRFVNAVRFCILATSLGGVETIVQHSASMTHATLDPETRRAAGVADGLIRLSAGIEDVDDIGSDILQALDKV